MTKNKRTIRKYLENGNIRFSLSGIITTIFVVSMLTFVSVQLVTNTTLAPLGQELASYNDEKNLLIEQNRELEQEIAKNSSVTIISKYADKKLNLAETNSDKTVYATPSTLTAMK